MLSEDWVSEQSSLTNMWTARARWKVDSGALDSAVVLVQGSHADWEDVGREESTTNQNSLILAQPDIPAPCEITSKCVLWLLCLPSYMRRIFGMKSAALLHWPYLIIV